MINEFLNEIFDDGFLITKEKLKIFKAPSPVLKKKALPVETFDQELIDLCKEMLFTMYAAPGIGLAAPQVGKSLRIFIVDNEFNRELIKKPDGKDVRKYSELNPKIVINPEFIETEGEVLYEEGCLSLPGIFENIKRHEKIKVKYFDPNGSEVIETLEGLAAICFQHEHDHLEGITMLDHLSPLKRNFYLNKIRKANKKK